MQVAREVREEAGVEVEDVRILGSQPWPIGKSTGFEHPGSSVLEDPGCCMYDTADDHVHRLLCMGWQSRLCALAGAFAARRRAALGVVYSVHVVHACRQRRLVRADDRLYSQGEVRYAAHGCNRDGGCALGVQSRRRKGAGPQLIQRQPPHRCCCSHDSPLAADDNTCSWMPCQGHSLALRGRCGRASIGCLAYGL